MTLVARPPRVARQGRSRQAEIERQRAVGLAIVEALAYADVFDWPLTPNEVHRFLPLRADRAEVEAGLAMPALREFVSRVDGHVTLAGREGLLLERRRREAMSAAFWPRADAWARRVGGLPFVRFVAITGSLAVGAATETADVDLLIVTVEGRLWLTRGLTVGIVRGARTRGVNLCPNYLLVESALELAERDLFTAHELVQMVPISGSLAWGEILARNTWYREFLPNHPGPPPPADEGGRGSALRRGLEGALRLGAVDRLERWEMERQLSRRGSGSGEARFGATVCKGHTGEHRRRTLATFTERLEQLGSRAGRP